jgi:hypothetical protein
MAETVRTKSGDTTSGILKAAGFSNYGDKGLWQEFAKINNLADYNKIQANVTYKLPTRPGAAPATPAPQVKQQPAGNYDPFQNFQPTQSPQAPEQISPYLSQLQETQKQILDMSQSPIDDRTDAERMTELKELTAPEIERPEVPNFEDTFFQLREEFDIDEIENELNLLQDDVYAIENQLREELGIEEGKPVNLRVISGRQSETQRQAFLKLDYYNRSITRATNQLTTANNMISTVINLKGMDYENARTAYNDEMKNNLALYAQLRGEKESDRTHQLNLLKESADLTTTLYEMEQKEIQRAEDNARSNLQIIMNSIDEGAIKYSELDGNTKLMISKLEAQSGLPSGFVSKLKSSVPDQEIKSVTNRQTANGDTYADIIMVDRDGKISVQSQYLGKSRLPATGGSTKTDAQIQAEFIDKNVKGAIDILADVDEQGAEGKSRNIDKGLSEEETRKALDRIVALAGGDEDLGIALHNRAMKQGGYWAWNP